MSLRKISNEYPAVASNVSSMHPKSKKRQLTNLKSNRNFFIPNVLLLWPIHTCWYLLSPFRSLPQTRRRALRYHLRSNCSRSCHRLFSAIRNNENAIRFRINIIAFMTTINHSSNWCLISKDFFSKLPQKSKAQSLVWCGQACKDPRKRSLKAYSSHTCTHQWISWQAQLPRTTQHHYAKRKK